MLYDGAGTKRAGLVLLPDGPDGGSGLTLADATGQPRASLNLTADGPGFHLYDTTGQVRAELTLAPAGPGRTQAELVVSGPLLLGFSRGLPRAALARLHDLCQTADML